MDKLKYIKLKNEDGSYTNSIPLAVDSYYVDVNGSTLDETLSTLATKREVMAVASGSPSGVYSTVTDLVSDDPDHNKIYVVSADGHWYYYDDENWQDGGAYQATEIDPNDPVIAELDDAVFYKNWANLPTTTVSGKFMYVDRDPASTNSNGKESGYGGYFHTNTISVRPGDKFRVTGQSRVNTPLCLFYNENYEENDIARHNSYIGYYGSSSEVVSHNNVEITVPANARYVIFNNTQLIEFWGNASKIEKIEKELKRDVYQDEEIENSTGLFSTTILDIKTQYGYSYVSRQCVAGEKLKIEGMSINPDFRLWDLIDATSGLLIQSSESGSGSVQYITEEYIVPVDGILYVNGNMQAGHPAKIYLADSYDAFEYADYIVEGIDEEIETLDEKVDNLENYDFEIKNLERRCHNLEDCIEFAWKDFDKSYFAFVIDDCNSFTVPTYDLFHEENVPLGVATIVGRLNTVYTDYEPNNTRSIKDILELVEADGGEVLAHYSGNLADPEYAEEHPGTTYITSKQGWDERTKDVKKTLENNGFTVRGLIRADASQAYSNMGEEYCRKYFDYSDNMGQSSEFKLGTRKFFIGVSTMQEMKNWIDTACETPGFYPFCLHGNRQDEPLATVENLTEIIEYIKDKGNNVAEITTYSKVFDEFKTTTIEKHILSEVQSLLNN